MLVNNFKYELANGKKHLSASYHCACGKKSFITSKNLYTCPNGHSYTDQEMADHRVNYLKEYNERLEALPGILNV
jgi:hypothetical protein